MRQMTQNVLRLFDELHQARQSLQDEFKACLKEFYALARAKYSLLTVRPFPARDGAIRAVYLAMRLKGNVEHEGRNIHLLKHVKGRINDGLIYNVARDYPHKEDWKEADRERAALNGRSRLVNLAANNLHQALAKRFGSRAKDLDRVAAAELLRRRPWASLHHPALLGLAVYDRVLGSLEDQISVLAAKWKGEFPDLPFEPIIRWREGGGLRLSWGFVDRFYDASRSFQVRSSDIPGGLTDRWLRSQPTLGSPRRRKAALGHAMRIRPLHRSYSELLVWGGRLKAKGHQALTLAGFGACPEEGRDAG